MVLGIGSHTATDEPEEIVAMTTTHRISTTAVLILSLAAAGAPRASAMPIGPDTASGAYAQSSTAIRPNPDEQTATGATANRASAAVYSRQDKSTIPATEPAQPTRVPPILAAPNPSQTAALRQAQHQARLAYLADHQSNGARYSSAEMNAYASAIPTGAPSTVVHIVSHDGRFDWGDAGIGAAGGLGLALLGVAGAVSISQQRRARRSKGSAAITT
jgi:hypothetical protein